MDKLLGAKTLGSMVRSISYTISHRSHSVVGWIPPSEAA